MRILAQYTIYNGVIYILHVFDIGENQICHFKMTEETSHTYYVHGIAMIGDKINDATLSKIENIINKKQTSLDCQYEIALALTAYIPPLINHPNIYIATFPFVQIASLPFK